MKKLATSSTRASTSQTVQDEITKPPGRSSNRKARVVNPRQSKPVVKNVPGRQNRGLAKSNNKSAGSRSNQNYLSRIRKLGNRTTSAAKQLRPRNTKLENSKQMPEAMVSVQDELLSVGNLTTSCCNKGSLTLHHQCVNYCIERLQWHSWNHQSYARDTAVSLLVSLIRYQDWLGFILWKSRMCSSVIICSPANISCTYAMFWHAPYMCRVSCKLHGLKVQEFQSVSKAKMQPKLIRCSPIIVHSPILVEHTLF